MEIIHTSHELMKSSQSLSDLCVCNANVSGQGCIHREAVFQCGCSEKMWISLI